MRIPTNGFDQRSPSRWMAKIDTAIALARTSGGTARRMTALIGDVPRKSARMQKKTSTKKTPGDGARKQATTSGAPIAPPSAQMRSSPRTVSRSTTSGAPAVLGGDLLADVVRPLAADRGRERAGDDRDHAEAEVRDVEREAVALEEERGRPVRERADRRRVRAEAVDTLAIEIDREQPPQVALHVGLLGQDLARGLDDHETHEREEEAWAAGHEERAPPAPARLDEAADEIPERAADRRRGVEIRERSAALLGRA